MDLLAAQQTTYDLDRFAHRRDRQCLGKAKLAKSGTAILVISSDLPEIIGICDRVIIMRAGRIEGELRRTATSPLNQEDIMALATGVEQLDAS